MYKLDKELLTAAFTMWNKEAAEKPQEFVIPQDMTIEEVSAAQAENLLDYVIKCQR